ncbi:MAG: hypothetical protein IPK83_01390 [Planctomycetes bacterium]|nr:hypothetical protein [Planctomycetota bacterium]
MLGTSRAEEFSPVKNATGVDSVETAKRDISGRAARWLERAGIRVPRDAAGEPISVCEVDSMAALDAEELRTRISTGEIQPQITERTITVDG